MIRSMTAFAKAIRTTDDLHVEIEIRTYNNRHLDISLRVPHGYSSLEEKMKGLINQRLSRGRVEIRLTLQKKSEESCRFEIDSVKALALKQVLNELRDTIGLTQDLPIDPFISSASGIIKPVEVVQDLDTEWEEIRKTLEDALTDLIDMRDREGDFMLKDLSGRMDNIENILDDVESGSTGLIKLYQEKLTDRIKALTDGKVELDEGRITQEAAFLADKSDISEEIVRSRSHIIQFRNLLQSEEPGGRKLNFLLQEFNREFNTIGSKIGKADIAHMVVDVKAELEKIREQVQNIE